LANRLPEDAGVVATDEEDLVALQFRWLLWALVSSSAGGDEEAVGLGEQGDGKVEKVGVSKQLFTEAWKLSVKHFRH
jgi:hypothetical protein